jgi:hypothetical protein
VVAPEVTPTRSSPVEVHKPMRNQVHALGSRTNDQPRSAKGRWEQFAAIAKDSLFIVAVGFTAIALLASVWLALLWPLANDAAPISAIFP